ncbi:MAG: alanine racemase [Bacteroidales bacterium]|nr:alanine racemase [Bacteroidales bacterium]
MTVTQHAQLEISKKAILNNYKFYRSQLKPSTKMLVVVKANSYGHGAEGFAKLLEGEGVDYLGVATPIEGIGLRHKGINAPILVLTTGMESYPEMINHNLEPGIPTIEALTRFCKEVHKCGRKNYPIHIAIDTGMHRLGFMEKEIDGLIETLKATDAVEVKSLYSHLAAADEAKHNEFTLGQIKQFQKLSDKIINELGYKPLRHILNSAGIDNFPEYQMDMVRLGLGIYGFSGTHQDHLMTTATLKCPILQIKELEASEGTVGYGRHGVLGPGKKKIATICVGYADGLNRKLGKGAASFQVNGKMAPTIGTICMDMCMIDITGIDAKIGDAVTIFGDKPSVKDLADILGTIPYEVFTSIDSRVKRIYTD